MICRASMSCRNVGKFRQTIELVPCVLPPSNSPTGGSPPPPPPPRLRGVRTCRQSSPTLKMAACQQTLREPSAFSSPSSRESVGQRRPSLSSSLTPQRLTLNLARYGALAALRPQGSGQVENNYGGGKSSTQSQVVYLSLCKSVKSSHDPNLCVLIYFPEFYWVVCQSVFIIFRS